MRRTRTNFVWPLEASGLAVFEPDLRLVVTKPQRRHDACYDTTNASLAASLEARCTATLEFVTLTSEVEQANAAGSVTAIATTSLISSGSNLPSPLNSAYG